MNFRQPAGLTDTGMHALVCDLSGVQPSAATIDALARLQLAARRRGCQVRLRRASDELRRLVAFTGLTDVLPE